MPEACAGGGLALPPAGAVFSHARAGQAADIGWELERGRPLAERADASTAAKRGAQRGAAREREGAFEYAVVTVERRYSLLTKHYSVGDRPG